MNGPLKIDRQAIEWRRNQTLELAARGKSQREISTILQVSEATTSSRYEVDTTASTESNRATYSK